MKLHEAVARNLSDHDVDLLFGLIGDANLYLVDAYSRLPGCRFMPATHEALAPLTPDDVGQ